MAQELTYKWIQDRIRDLHAGKLSAQDKARLESIALQDPFVADALEGYEAHPDAMHEAYLTALEEKIRHTPRARRRWLIPNLTVTAIAASVILIIATYAVISRMDQTPEEALTIILNADSLNLHDTLPAGTVVWNEEVEAEVEAEAEAEAEAMAEAEAEAEEEVIAISQAKEKTVPPQSSPTEPEETRTETMSPAPAVSSPAAAAEMRLARDEDVYQDMAFYANQMDPALMARRATGRVVSVSGDPLTGADIRITGTNLGVTSGEEGRFELYLPLPQSEVEIYLPGYVATRVQMQQGETDKDIIIAPAPQTEDLALQRAQQQKSSLDDIASTAGSGMANAPGSAETWNTFLLKNSRFPLRENYYLPGKNVTLQFTVRPNGKATSIRIVHSSGDARLDREAVRLIGSWEQWTCVEQNCDQQFTLYFE